MNEVMKRPMHDQGLEEQDQQDRKKWYLETGKRRKAV